MGERFYLDLKCAYCGKLNENVYYAPTCGIYKFQCCKCMSTNFITYDFNSTKLEEINKKDISRGIAEHSNAELIKEVIRNGKM